MSLLLLGTRGMRRGATVPWAPNRPAGFISIGDTSFDTERTNGSFDNHWQISWTGVGILGGIETPLFQRIADSSGGNGPWVGRMNFSDGHNNDNVVTGGWALFNYSLPKGVVREMYTALTLRFSASYVVHGAPTPFSEKLYYPILSGAVGQVPVVQLGDNGSGTGAPPFRLATWSYREDGVPLMNVPENIADVGLQRDRWYHLEIHQRLNSYNPDAGVTKANADGFTRIWVDGTLVQDFQNWRGCMMSTQQAFFDTPRLSATRGGGVTTTPAPFGGMWRDYDRLLTAYKVEA